MSSPYWLDTGHHHRPGLTSRHEFQLAAGSDTGLPSVIGADFLPSCLIGHWDLSEKRHGAREVVGVHAFFHVFISPAIVLLVAQEIAANVANSVAIKSGGLPHGPEDIVARGVPKAVPGVLSVLL